MCLYIYISIYLYSESRLKLCSGASDGAKVWLRSACRPSRARRAYFRKQLSCADVLRACVARAGLCARGARISVNNLARPAPRARADPMATCARKARVLPVHPGCCVSARYATWRGTTLARLGAHCRAPAIAIQEWPRSAQEWPRSAGASRSAQEWPRSTQERPGAPRSGHGWSRSGHDRPGGLRSAQEWPRSAQECPRSAQEWPRSAQERPGVPQERPGMAQERPGVAQERPGAPRSGAGAPRSG